MHFMSQRVVLHGSCPHGCPPHSKLYGMLRRNLRYLDRTNIDSLALQFMQRGF
jgi:hypothetical protein